MCKSTYERDAPQSVKMGVVTENGELTAGRFATSTSAKEKKRRRAKKRRETNS